MAWNIWQRKTVAFVSASREDVFDYLADLTRHRDWDWAGAEKHQTSPGPVGVGSTFVKLWSYTAQTGLRKRSRRVTVTRFDPFARVAWDEGGVVLDFTLARRSIPTYISEGDADGKLVAHPGTLVTLTETSRWAGAQLVLKILSVPLVLAWLPVRWMWLEEAMQRIRSRVTKVPSVTAGAEPARIGEPSAGRSGRESPEP